ncbi:hypothetical protein [Streptomyces sp. NPDC048419]|uniref:hypothetical protein n=1 Tax=Streptomyces sp. NPDC048419 TaxID=3365547 RepID=UPI00372013A4
MDKTNAGRRPRHPLRWIGQHPHTRHAREWARRQGRDVSGEFLRGAAYKLGSGAVTLIILWWETWH